MKRRRSLSEFTRERDEKISGLVNSRTRTLDSLGASQSKMSSQARLREERSHAVRKSRRLVELKYREETEKGSVAAEIQR